MSTRPRPTWNRGVREVSLMGLGLDSITEREAIATILDAIDDGQGGWVITPNLEHLRRYVRVPHVQALFGQADLVLADGMPLVWASRLKGTPVPERVPGSSLIWTLSEEASRRGRSVFLLGGVNGSAQRAAKRLKRRYEALHVAGTLSPPFGFEDDPTEFRRIEAALESAEPDIVYVGLGFPRQEELIRELRRRFPETWFLGIGISIAFAAGDIARAPRWMQNTGLEWLHRLAQEPRRLAPRYLVHGPPMAIRLLIHGIGARIRRRG